MPRPLLRAIVRVTPIAVALGAIAACALQTNGTSETGSLAPGDVADGSAASRDSGAGGGANDDSTPHDEIDAPKIEDDASAAHDATHDAPSVDAGDPCDRDHDGHRDTGNGCAGDDCCDSDKNVFPGQKAFFDVRSACSSFDYDCDGKASPESGTVSCSLGFFTCSGDGFASATACGASGTFTSCNWAGFSCSKADDTRVQRCH